MQSLWSRIAQTRLSCHCPSCVSAGASGVGRRTTTAAGKRPVRWALSSTFVYSGIFAAAATTDAGIKQKRRDQWDRAIANIKYDLDQPALDQSTSLQESTPTVQEMEEKVRYKPLFDEPQEVLFETESHLDGPPWPTNTGLPLKFTFVAPNSIYAGHFLRQRAAANRWTAKKLRTVELSVDKLILRMLMHLDELGLRQNLDHVVPESCLDLFNAPTAHLRALFLYTNDQHIESALFPDPHADIDDLPRQHQHGVTYTEDRVGEYQRTAASLNTALSLLFQKRESGQLSHQDLVAKVAYNLYISPAAPNIDCWNTLLVGFLNDDQDAAIVAPTLTAIRNANVRMNEITLKTTLKYFIMTNSRNKFVSFVDKMRGLNGGLSLARPDININDSGRSRLVRDEETGKVYQKPYPTPGVFEALVQGVLHFVGFDAALRVCKDMGQQGWGLSIRGLTPLLDDRARNADYESGCQVWDLIKMLQRESRAKGRPEKLFAQTYTAMLRLCSACNEMARFDEILREARSAKYSHNELLALFRQEMQPQQPRKIQERRGHLRDVARSVTPEDFEKVVPKEGRGRIQTPVADDPEYSGTQSPPPNATNDERWLNSKPGSKVNAQVKADDDWLESPMMVRE